MILTIILARYPRKGLGYDPTGKPLTVLGYKLYWSNAAQIIPPHDAKKRGRFRLLWFLGP